MSLCDFWINASIECNGEVTLLSECKRDITRHLVFYNLNNRPREILSEAELILYRAGKLGSKYGRRFAF
jgi:hypothetical protein